MKITNNGITNASLTPKQEVPAQSDGTREIPSEANALENVAFNPSAEWVRTLDLVRQQPDVREDRVQEVLQRLARGEYSTFETAERTADAILQSQD